MAQMFYSMEEVLQKLHCTDEGLRNLVAEGKLREFRDGVKIMFKVDEVDELVASGDVTGGIEPAPSKEDDILAAAPDEDGSSLGLLPLDSGSMIGLSPADSADQISLDDTTSASDKDDTVITEHGINVFEESDADLADLADPLAQTQLAPDIADQIDLDSGSSGSGLLDLSREADDTSLGAELLEEIYPGAEEGEEKPVNQLEIPAEEEAAIPAESEIPVAAREVPVRAATVYDSSSGIFGAMMVVPFLALIYLACLATAGIGNVPLSMMTGISGYIWFVVGGAGVLVLLILGVGTLMAGGGKPREAKAKTKKPKKPKKAKKKAK